MWPRDRGLLAHGVRVMRNDDHATTQCEERVGDRQYLKFESITRMTFSYNSTQAAVGT
jgi:hypothetical protein